MNKAYHGVIDYNPDSGTRIWAEMEAGDTIFFHPIILHGSGANRTDGFRKVRNIKLNSSRFRPTCLLA